MNNRKKGQALGGLSNSAIAVLLLILVVAVGATVLQTIQGTQLVTATDNANETYTIDNATAETLTNARCVATTVNITNTTNGVEFQAANYSVSCTTSASTITWLTGTGNNTGANITYNFEFDQFPQDYNITNNGLQALVTYSDFFSVIVVVVVFAVIIGLFAFFTLRGRETSI